MSDDFDRLLRSAFPQNTDAAVVRSIRTAVALADDVRRNTPWLSNLIGSDHRGLLRRAAAMWQFEADCIAGNLPFDASVVPNTTGSSHLLMIRSHRYEAHIVRTDSEGAFPQDAPIRQDKSLSNQADLFVSPKIVPIQQQLAAVSTLYSWLSFNADTAGELTHVCWCMPDAAQRGFLSRVNILRLLGADATVEDDVPPAPDLSQKIRFRSDLDRFVGGKLTKTKK